MKISTDTVENILIALVTAAMGAVGWLVRRVFTNEKQIALLEKSLEDRDRKHAALHQDVREIRDHIMGNVSK